jgi:lipopolysaccharide/colanic/teichoic acid biosynthesis glycosyltransferase
VSTPAGFRTRSAPSAATAKHVFDVVGAVTALVLLSPLLVLIAVLVRLTSKGPVLSYEPHQGYQGQLFLLMRFRTLYANLEGRLGAIDARNGPTDKPDVWRWHDATVTQVGRWLRRLHLDGLPQLVNVLLGEMSLIGPMPLRIWEDLHLKQVQPEAYQRRMTALPGMTGAWQVEGHDVHDLEVMLQADLEYIDHWSLARDFAIAARAAWGRLRGRGAS